MKWLPDGGDSFSVMFVVFDKCGVVDIFDFLERLFDDFNGFFFGFTV